MSFPLKIYNYGCPPPLGPAQFPSISLVELIPSSDTIILYSPEYK